MLFLVLIAILAYLGYYYYDHYIRKKPDEMTQNATPKPEPKPELIAKLDRLVPPTGDPKIDGCPPLLPPQELLDRKSESEIEAEEKEKERQSLNGKTVWKDEKRKLFFEGTEPILVYDGERYTFSCQPYEPMAIILHKGEAVVYIHNAFYPDECKGFIEDSRYLVGTITGKHHNAERFCRLLTTAIDGFFDCQIDEVESKMQKDLVLERGLGSIQFETRDFKCENLPAARTFRECTEQRVPCRQNPQHRIRLS